MAPSPTDISSALSKLDVFSPPKASKNKPKKKPAVADSWEDELSGEEGEAPSHQSDDENSPAEPPFKSSESPRDPPPTPASPTPFDLPYASPAASPSPHQAGTPSSRPEKTTAVANRLIAGALGVRAPKRSQEEREYDKAAREKERRRKYQEREEREKAGQAKKGMWDD